MSIELEGSLMSKYPINLWYLGTADAVPPVNSSTEL